MSVEAMSWVFEHSQSKGSERLVLLALANEASKTGEVSAYHRSYSFLAAQANVSPSTVWRAIEKLVDLGELRITRQGGGRERNDYQIEMSSTCILQAPASRRHLQDAVAAPASRSGSTCISQGQHLQDAVPITPFSPVALPLSPVDVPAPAKLSTAQLNAYFDEFWQAYPIHRERKAAAALFERVVRKERVDPQAVIDGARRYRDDPNRDENFTKLPTTWLNKGCWDDVGLPERRATAAQRNKGSIDKVREKYGVQR